LLEAALLVLFVTLAIGLRVGWVLHSQTYPVEDVDTWWYDRVAKNVAAGHGIANPEDGITPTALFPPGYPLVLGTAYKLVGTELNVAQGLNIAVAAGLVLATYLAGRLSLDRPSAIFGALLMSVFPSQVIYSSLVMSDILFAFLLWCVIATLLVASRTQEGQETPIITLAALGAGAAALFRGQALVLLLAVPAWWILHRRNSRAVAMSVVFIIGMLAVIAPWTLRNWYRLDYPVPISTNTGWNAAIGHNDSAEGKWMSPGHFFWSTLDYPQPKREVEFNKIGIDLAWDYARTHPLDELKLSVRKAYYLWRTDADAVRYQELGVAPFLGADERARLTNLADYFYFGVLALAAVGLLGTWRERRQWWSLVILLVIGWTGFHMLIFGEGRFHYPVLPAFSIGAAAGLVATARLALRVDGDASDGRMAMPLVRRRRTPSRAARRA
jgi:4-amino-4-deoxy-L-arabinose transferase-like glycosyltransferase